MGWLGRLADFIQDHWALQGLAILLGLCGIVWSGLLYFRVYCTWVAEREAREEEERQRRRSHHRTPVPVKTPEPPAEAPRQENLLVNLGTAAKAAVEEEDRKKTDEMEPHPGKSNYGVDIKGTTKLDMKRYPVGVDTSTAIIKQDEIKPPDKVTTELMKPPRVGDVHAAIREAVDDSMRDRGDATATGAARGETIEAAEAARLGITIEELRNRRRVLDEKIRRLAKRHEELGFHIGITSDGKASEPTVSEEDKRLRLEQLGIGPGPAVPRRMATAELDGILARLDHALGDQAQEPASTAPGETPTVPVTPEKSVTSRLEEMFGSASEDKEARLGAAVVRPLSDHDAPVAADTAGDSLPTDRLQDRAEDDDLAPDTDPRRSSSVALSEGVNRTEPPEISGDADTVRNRRDHGTDDEETPDPDPSDAGSQNALETGTRGRTAKKTAAQPEPTPESQPDPKVAKPAEGKPTAGKQDIPSWARIDTFDDDAGNGPKEPKQHSLFD